MNIYILEIKYVRKLIDVIDLLIDIIDTLNQK